MREKSLDMSHLEICELPLVRETLDLDNHTWEPNSSSEKVQTIIEYSDKYLNGEVTSEEDDFEEETANVTQENRNDIFVLQMDESSAEENINDEYSDDNSIGEENLFTNQEDDNFNIGWAEITETSLFSNYEDDIINLNLPIMTIEDSYNHQKYNFREEIHIRDEQIVQHQ